MEDSTQRENENQTRQEPQQGQQQNQQGQQNQQNQQGQQNQQNQQGQQQNQGYYSNMGQNQNMYNNYGYDPNIFKQDNSGLAVASMILGIISICCCFIWYIGPIFATIGLALGIVSLKEGVKQRSFAITGIVCSSVGLFLTFVVIIMIVMFGVFSGDTGSTSGFDIDTIRHGVGSIIKS